MKSTTKFVCIVAILGIGAYDLLAVNFGGEAASVSAWVSSMGLNYPFLMFVIGFLMGHWFAVDKVSDMVQK